MDTLLIVDFPNSYEDQVVSDDDSGRGLWSANAEMVYRAPARGEYFIVVADASDEATGGYYLSVEEAPAGSETVHVPPAPTGPEVVLVGSPFGIMRVFEDPLGYFEVQIPQPWIEEEPDPSEFEIFKASSHEGNGSVTIYIEEGIQVPLAEYAEAIESGLIELGGDLTRETVETPQGLPAVLFEWATDDVALIWLTYLSDGGVAIHITYSFPAGLADAGRELAYYSFGTFLVN